MSETPAQRSLDQILAVDANQADPYSGKKSQSIPEITTMSSLVGQITLGIYALLLGIGGLMGYLKAGSRSSLIAGSISAVVALAALGLSVADHQLGVPLGLLLSITLFVLFGYRYAVKTGKFMPSGLLAVASLIVLAVMFLVMDWSGS